MIESFIKDKFETHLDKRITKVESMQLDLIKGINLTNSKLANTKESISLTENESSKSLKELENVVEPIKLKPERKIRLLNSQINTFTYDLSHNLKEAESTLSHIEILRNKTAEIFYRQNNPELEMDFRATCSAYQTNTTLYDPPLIQAYQDYLNAYQQKTSLYNILDDHYGRTNLIIYNTETETKEIKILKTEYPIECYTCIAQLPNGKLFYFYDGWTALISIDGGVEELPYGNRLGTCYSSSCIYFNNSVYCFGGQYSNNLLTLSSRYDLNQNRWIQLTPIPDTYWVSAV